MKNIINEIRASILSNQSVFVYGGWGIGKTHLIKNEFVAKYKEEFNILYIDSRVVDLNENVLDIIADYIESNLSKKDLITKYGKKALKLVLDASIVVSNVVTGANLQTTKKTSGKDFSKILAKKMKNDKETLIILDELDRITPKSILKILNYVNGLSLAFSKTKNNFKIMVVGNRDELKSILSSQFNIKDKDNFLEKYFDMQVDIGSIQNRALNKVASKKFIEWLERNDALIALEELTTISARTFERKWSKLETLMSKYGEIFSQGVYFAFFVCDLFSKQEIKWDYFAHSYSNKPAGFYNSKGRTHIIGKLTFNGKPLSTYKDFHRESKEDPVEDIKEFKSLSRFEDWMSKWESWFSYSTFYKS